MTGREESYSNLDYHVDLGDDHMTNEEWHALISEIPLKEVNSSLNSFLDRNSSRLTSRAAIKAVIEEYKQARRSRSKQ